jgi:hypothetical protein
MDCSSIDGDELLRVIAQESLQLCGMCLCRRQVLLQLMQELTPERVAFTEARIAIRPTGMLE